MDLLLSRVPHASSSRALVLFVLSCVLSLPAAGRASRGWEFLGPSNIGGRVLAIAFDPTDASIVYAGSAGGGLWKSEDGGDTWFAITDELASLAIGGVAVSPIDPNVVVIGTGEGTWNIDRIAGVGALRSTDAGLTWDTTSLVHDAASGHGFQLVEASPLTGTFLAGATDGLWRSSDAGATWTLVKGGADYYDAKWKPKDANVCYAARGSAPGGLNGIKISTDDGVAWFQAGIGQPQTFLIRKTKIAVTAATPEIVYAIYTDPGGDLLGVYRSLDEGATWELRSFTPNIPGGQGWYNLSLVADPDEASTLLAGGVRLYRSQDGGATWAQTGTNVHVDHHAAVYEPGSTEGLWVGTDGGVWKSPDDGLTWVPRSDGQGTAQFYDISVAQTDAHVVLGGAQDHGLLRRIGDTTDWELSLGGGVVCEICPTDENLVYASGSFGSPFRSVDGGETWSSISNGVTGTGRWIPPLALDPSDCNHLYTATSDGIFRTTNGGSSWELVSDSSPLSIDVSPVNGDIVWGAVGGSVWFTTDDGETWSRAAEYGFPTGGATRILADPVIQESAFVTFSGDSDETAHIAMTMDWGTSWTDVSGDFAPQPVNAIAIDPDHTHHWYVGTDVGVWIARNGGWNWGPYGADLPNAVVVDLEIRDNARKLVAATHGRGVWQIGIATGLGTDGAVVNPGTSPLQLDPPSPNPTQESTLLRFSAKHDGPVTLEVIDVQGRLVHRLLRLSVGNGTAKAVTWRCEDLPNGVYFVVLSAGEEQTSRKLVIAR